MNCPVDFPEASGVLHEHRQGTLTTLLTTRDGGAGTGTGTGTVTWLCHLNLLIPFGVPLVGSQDVFSGETCSTKVFQGKSSTPNSCTLTNLHNPCVCFDRFRFSCRVPTLLTSCGLQSPGCQVYLYFRISQCIRDPSRSQISPPTCWTWVMVW